MTAEKPAPVGFATLPYFGVNSFKFTNAKGDSTVVRYQMLPEGGAEYLTKEQLAEAGPNYLAEEIRSSVQAGGSGWLMWNPAQTYTVTWSAVPVKAPAVSGSNR